MSLEARCTLSKAAFLCSGLILLGYSWLGVIGFRLLATGAPKLEEYVVLTRPILAFPFFLMNLRSQRICTIALWMYFLFTLIVHFGVSWPALAFDFSLADRALLAGLLFQQLGYSFSCRHNPNLIQG
jgi:hypothetical protein